MGVLLTLADVSIWLIGDETQLQALMRLWPKGRLRIKKATDVDWSAP